MFRLAILGVLSGVVVMAGPILVTGPDAGATPQVNVFNRRTLELIGFFSAYPTTMLGGVRVAAGDLNSDGIPDIITGAGSGSSEVRVFDGAGVTANGNGPAMLRSFEAYPGFTGGVFVAAGDVNGDQVTDIITSPGVGGGPHIKVFDGTTGATIHSFLAYDPQFLGGVYVSGGDVNGDGFDDIITGAGAGGGPHVKVFDGRDASAAGGFFAFDPAFSGGVRVGAGDVNGDGTPDIITGAGPGGGGHVRVFDGRTLAELDAFFAFGSGFTGGVTVAGGSDVVGSGAGIRSTVNIYDVPGGVPSHTLSPYGDFSGGVFVATSSDVPEPATWFLCGGVFGLMWIAAVLHPRARYHRPQITRSTRRKFSPSMPRTSADE